jgi:AraC-like DNA-binding protein
LNSQEKCKQEQKIDYPLRVGPLTNIPALLESFGCNADVILESCGFSVEQFSHTDFQIGFLAATRLLACCVEATGCPWFGLKLAEHATPSHLGITGFLMVTSATVADALEAVASHLDLHDQGGSVTLTTSNDYAVLGYTINQPGVHVPDQVYDFSIANICNTLRALCGPGWAPEEVMLSRTTPDDVKPYRRFFRAPIRFNADESGIVFPVRWLSHKPPFSDPLLHEYLKHEAENMHARLQQDLIGRLRSNLGQSIAIRDFSVASVASRLGLHERTLGRRLRAEGTTFRQQLDRVRQGMGEQLLGVTSMEVRRVAEMLGYSSTSAFNHAFRRWNGQSPEKWRLENSNK